MLSLQSASHRSADIDVSPHGGLVCHVRPLRKADAPLLADCFARLSIASRRLRFFAAKQVLSDAELHFFSDADQRDHVALAAVALDEQGRETTIVGAARCFRLAADGDTAEMSIAVADTAQGIGLGSALMARLIEAAQERGIRRFRFEVLQGNRGMRALAARFGSTALSVGDGVVDYEMLLPDASPADASPRWLPDTAPLAAAFEDAWLGTAEQAMRLASLVLAAPFSAWAIPRPDPGRGA
jgi:RimJ/RimL family protein N-acetyltransferase